MEKQINSNSFFRFEDLRVYHKSLDYVNWLLNQNCQLNGMDADLVYKPLVHSANEVSLNIAEGSSRHKTQLIQFLKDAKAAIRECVVYTAIAYKKGIFTQEQNDASVEVLMEMTKMLGAMIASLQKSVSNRTVKQEEVQKPEAEDEFMSENFSFEY
ncbi:MAG: four helix bundle protein [Bacteroidales bacterium]|jgi:four helix bundle protein|nr:four helix bundle protein [Bacteroidales bacterium]